jgi:hypothetical protein
MFECQLCHKIFTTNGGLTYHVSHKVCQKSPTEPKYKVKIVLKPQAPQPQAPQPQAPQPQPQLPPAVSVEAPFPHSFGNEEPDHLLKKMPNLFDDALIQHTGRSIEYLVEKIHCNESIFPEYTNLYIKGYKSPFVLVSNGYRFLNKPQKVIIEQMITNLVGMLQQYIDSHRERVGQPYIDKFEVYRTQIKHSNEREEKSAVRKDCEIEIVGMLLDMRLIVEENPGVKKILDT